MVMGCVTLAAEDSRKRRGDIWKDMGEAAEDVTQVTPRDTNTDG